MADKTSGKVGSSRRPAMPEPGDGAVTVIIGQVIRPGFEDDYVAWQKKILGDQTAPPPTDFKTSIAVWMGLYPTVVLLTLLVAPPHLRLWIAILVGNLLSSFAMTYITMPYYSNPILGWWLKPRRDVPQARSNVLGIALVLLINAAWGLVFYLVTVRFWHLR